MTKGEYLAECDKLKQAAEKISSALTDWESALDEFDTACREVAEEMMENDLEEHKSFEFFDTFYGSDYVITPDNDIDEMLTSIENKTYFPGYPE